MKRTSDICLPPPRIHSFMVAKAIQNEVDREDLIRWSKTETKMELPEYIPEPRKPWSRAAIYAFAKGMMP